MRVAGENAIAASDVKALLSEVYARGRSDAEQDQKIAFLEQKVTELQNSQAENGALVRGAGLGLVHHLQDHFNNDEKPEEISPVSTLRVIYDALTPQEQKIWVKKLSSEMQKLLEADNTRLALAAAEDDSEDDFDEKDIKAAPPKPQKRPSVFARG
jgi:hypothetical protein